MPASIWGPNSDVIQLGSFDPTESAILKGQCAEELAIVPLLGEVPTDPERGLDLLTAAVGLKVVSDLLHLDAFRLKPDLRLLGFFGHRGPDEQDCNALAQPADPRVKNTF